MTIATNTMGTAKEAYGTARHAAEDAAEAVRETAGDAAKAVRDTAGDAAKNVHKAISYLGDIGIDDVLSLVGLRRKASPLSALALVAGGVVLGAGLTLLFAPVSGQQARQQILKFLQGMSGRAKDTAEEVKEKASEVAGEVAGEVKERVGEVKEKASEVAGEVKERVGEVKEKASAMVGQAQTEGEQTQDDDRKGGRRRQNQAQFS